MIDSSRITRLFTQHFGEVPPELMLSSPGRINLIGEHTDYNQGWVLPAAINCNLIFAARKNDSGRLRFLAVDLGDDFECSVKDLARSTKSWANYLLGVAAQFEKLGLALPGIDCAFGGNIPLGAGLSSSAALECGFAEVLNYLLQSKLPSLQLAQMAQKAEHEYAGVRCGIMDQFAVMHGKRNHAMLLDCRSLEYRYVPVELPEHEFILCDSGVKHSLASSAYNQRREECETGVAAMAARNPKVGSLRDASLEQLDAVAADISPVVYQRCRYVIEENQRVLDAIDHLRRGEADAFGQLLYASHAGLRDQYAVSCDELDLLIKLARSYEGVAGARMMGGGFGGCTLNLVRRDAAADFITAIRAAYQHERGSACKVHRVSLADGAGPLPAFDNSSAGRP